MSATKLFQEFLEALGTLTSFAAPAAKIDYPHEDHNYALKSDWEKIGRDITTIIIKADREAQTGTKDVLDEWLKAKAIEHSQSNRMAQKGAAKRTPEYGRPA